MKTIKLSEKTNSILLDANHGRDVFTDTLEAFIESGSDAEVELDFRDIVTISPYFWDGFFSAAKESNKLNIDKIKRFVMFTGLYLNDIEIIAKRLNGRDGHVNVDNATHEKIVMAANDLKDQLKNVNDLESLLSNLNNFKSRLNI